MEANKKALPKWARVTLWIVQILLACAFIAAGIAKLIGAPQMVEVFKGVGVGQWFRYVTGAIEVIAGLSLFTSRFSGLGAALLAFTMVGAVFAHVFLIGGSPAAAAVLLVLCVVVVWMRQGESQAVLGIKPSAG